MTLLWVYVNALAYGSTLQQPHLHLHLKGQGCYFWVFEESVLYNGECGEDITVPAGGNTCQDTSDKL